VGMTLTQIGVVRAAYAGCNAVTRPISGHVVNKFGQRGVCDRIPRLDGFVSIRSLGG
jgi:hypothetical protein